MKNTINYLGKIFLLASFVLAVSVNSTLASPVIRKAQGANPAAIQSAVDQFRADLGGTNNGVGGSFRTGRREINWDGVPDNFAGPNLFPPDFFNANSPRGAVFFAIPDISQSSHDNFKVSAKAGNPTNTPVRFGDINATYSTIFQTFSAERLFVAGAARHIEISFFVPGTNIPATVSGFGAVFCDVDNSGGPNSTIVRLIGVDGKQLISDVAGIANNGLSFLGISMNAGERVARVIIENGNADFSSSNNDGVNGVDVVAMDDFIYGEPRAMQHHSSDFDGDGVSDAAIFRPSVGQWIILNSGSNTVTFQGWGQPGDIPVNGDFDGDQLSDYAIYRPSLGQWWILKSGGGNFAAQFGAPGDKPVPGDYDKDGKTDIGLFRPSNGNWLILRSSENFSSFFSFPFGSPGDLPVPASDVQ